VVADDVNRAGGIVGHAHVEGYLDHLGLGGAFYFVGVVRTVEAGIKGLDDVVVGEVGGDAGIGEDGGGGCDAPNMRTEGAADLRTEHVIGVEAGLIGGRLPGELEVAAVPIAEGEAERGGGSDDVGGWVDKQETRIGQGVGEDAVQVSIDPIATAGGGEAVDIAEITGVFGGEAAGEFIVTAIVNVIGCIRPPGPIEGMGGGGAKANLGQQAGGKA